MRTLIIGLGLLMLASGVQAKDRHERHRDRDRYETPYSNEAVARQREIRKAAREIDREREERAWQRRRIGDRNARD